MIDQELARQLMASFLDELHEHVTAIGRELLAQEKSLTASEIDQSWAIVFRAAHTLKGAAAVVNVQPIRDACHHLEDIFESYRDRQQAMPEQLTSKVLQAADAIEEAGISLRADEERENLTLEGSRLLGLMPELERLAKDSTDDGLSKPTDQTQVLPQQSEEQTDNELDSFSIHPQLKAVFLDELDEHVETFSRNILAIETAEDSGESQNLLNDLFRAAHSLKGAARAVQLNVVHDVCHQLENLLTDIRDEKVSVTSDIVSRVLETSDAIGDVGKRIRRGDGLKSSSIFRVKEKLNRLHSGTASVAPNEKVGPETMVKLESKVDPEAKVKPAAEVVEKTDDIHPETETKSECHAKPQAPAATKVTPTKVTPTGGEPAASIRVAAHKLDALLAHSGELLVVRGRFDLRAKAANELREYASELRSNWNDVSAADGETDFGKGRDHATPRRSKRRKTPVVSPPESLKVLTKKLDALLTGMEADNRLLSQTCSLLDDEIYHVRMLPFADACGGLERAVRDIATATRKKVRMKVEGADVEVDRSVLEGLKDPLLHLVRNAVDHGIEKPEQRTEIGKPAEARITVSAELRGGQVEVVVADDGSGFDLKRICEIASKRGIDVPDDPREQARLVFAPGFSTAKLITDISGRGVGLDVVKNRVEALHGAVDVSFVKGEGTRFTLMVPLTLTTIRSMLVMVNGQIYAIPTTSIRRLVRFGAADVRSSVGRDTLLLEDAPTHLVPMATPLGLKSKGLFSSASSKGLALVLAAGDQRVALSVDDVLSEQEILVKNLGSRMRRLRHFSGCTLLPSGQVALVTNSANIVRAALGSAATASGDSIHHRRKHAPRRLLLVDDSVTTLALLKNILETAGYDVETAVDGQQAWELSQEQEFDAVVSDVDMPRMDGFELTKNLRANAQTSEIPVVLITARGTDYDKEQGVHAGANAYIVKGGFNQQNLLDTLAQLV